MKLRIEVLAVVAVLMSTVLPSCLQKTVSADEPIALTGEMCQLDSQFMGSVFPMYNGEFFVMSSWLPDEALYIARVDGLDFKTDSLRLPIGDGPKEFREAVPLLLDSTLLLLDGTMGRTSSFTAIPLNSPDYTNSKSWQRTAYADMGSLRMPSVSFVAIDDTTMLVASSEFMSANTFSIIDVKNGTYRELDWSPDDGFSGPGIVKGGAYADNAYLYSHGDKYYYQCGEGHYGFIFTIEGDKVNVVKELFSEFPDYLAAPDGLNYNIRRKDGAMYTAAATDKHIYTHKRVYEYDGVRATQVAGTEVHAYDWDGNEVAEYQIDRMSSYIFVSPDDKYLFACSHDDDDYDKTVIMRYTLP